MRRKRITYIQILLDFVLFNVTVAIVLVTRPGLREIVRDGLLLYLIPSLFSLCLVALLFLFRQYRVKRRDRFLRQFVSAFNVVTMGTLLAIVVGIDLGMLDATLRGHLILTLVALFTATAVSRIIFYLWMGRRPDFSIKEPLIMRGGNGNGNKTPAPLILPFDLSLSEAKQRIEDSHYDFAVLTDLDGYYAGTVTDGDLIDAILRHTDQSVPVQDMMNRLHPVARETLSVGRIRQLILDRNLRYLPLLTNEGKPSRVVLLSDLDSKYNGSNGKRKSRRVLIIGGAGYIGSSLARYLLKRGYPVSVLDNLLYGYEPLRDLDNHPAYRFYEGDARNVQHLLTAMEDVDTVIHLAAIVGDPACELDHRTTIEVNYEASKLLVEACLHRKVERLIFTSTCSVYGASCNGELLTETSPINPVSLYAETKLRSEEAILGKAVPPLAATILRLATVFGFSYRPRFDLVVNTLTARALIDGEISIFGGTQWRPNVHVLDVARAFAAVMEAPKRKVAGQIFNVGSEAQNYRISELGKLVKKTIPDTKVTTIEAHIDPRDYRVGFSKIESTLGYNSRISVQEGIEEIVNAFHQSKFLHYSEKKYSNFKHLQ